MSDAPRIRVDKWLWFARFFKSRGLAGEAAASGYLRVNGAHVKKPAHAVKPGDTLSFPQAGRVRVVRILDIGTRRGPAPEAQALYEDLSPPPEPSPPGQPEAGAPPSRREREAAARLKRSALE